MNTHVVRQKYGQSKYELTALPRRQRGAVIVFTAIAMLVLLGAAAFSIDSAHLLLNNTRAQNIVDITALSAAKTLLETEGDTAAATADAITTFYASAKADSSGNREINEAVAPADIIIQYSETLVPFTPGVGSPEFVRVKVENLPLQPWFIQVLGLDKAITVSAVAGYTHVKVCEGLIPLMVCGCTPGVNGCPVDSFFGYEEEKLHVLKIASGNDPDVGPGNAQLLNLPGLSGSKDLSEAAAGGYNTCVGDDVATKPGQSVGPIRFGLNLRFRDEQGPLDNTVYQPDWKTDNPDDPPGQGVRLEDLGAGEVMTWNNGAITEASEIDTGQYDHESYEAAYDANSSYVSGTGRYKRREIRVVIGDCTAPISGYGDVPVLSYGCFFLTQPILPPSGGTGNQSYIVGEFFRGCPGEGPVTNDTTAVEKLVLFKDPDSNDS